MYLKVSLDKQIKPFDSTVVSKLTPGHGLQRFLLFVFWSNFNNTNISLTNKMNLHKRKLVQCKQYSQILTRLYISGVILDTYCVWYPHTMSFFCIFTTQKLYVQMLFRGASSSNCFKFTKIFPF